MGRRSTSLQASTALGAAMIARRGGQQQREVAAELGTTDATVSRLERGLNVPTAPVARALARWLGWTTDEVLDAAEQPATPPESTT